jgi:adenosylcobinamide-phosphate synthase
VRRPLAVALGLAGDAVFGEPPPRAHPVARFGAVMQSAEDILYADREAAGVLYAACGVAMGVAAGQVLRSTAAATALSVAGGDLGRAALAVAAALEEGDLEGARRLLPCLVGRAPAGLDEKEVARAVVESVAENTVDAVVAPALWALAIGASGALAYRAVNTLDAMVGHRSPRHLRFGWASARLDDAVAWVPARVTAGLVAAVRPRAARQVWEAVRRQAPAHPSPNAGVAEAAFAAALGLQLGGPTVYAYGLDVRPVLGTGRPPEPTDIARAVRLSREVTAALGLALFLLASHGHPAADRLPSSSRRGQEGGETAP